MNSPRNMVYIKKIFFSHSERGDTESFYLNEQYTSVISENSSERMRAGESNDEELNYGNQSIQ